jgi:hypothetical protein
LAEKVWAKTGYPTDARSLSDVLESILRLCVRQGIPYPAMLLKRKKGMERGTWLPRSAKPSDSAKKRSIPASSTPACSICGDTGYAYTKNGFSATLCGCGAWQKNKGLNAS